MPTRAARKPADTKRFEVQHPIGDYVLPKETRIENVRFDDELMHVTLADGRILSIPLSWIPTLKSAPAAERNKFEISRNRTMIVWDPERCAINEEVRISDYFGPYSHPDGNGGDYPSSG